MVDENSSDDLTIIPGIGTARERWLKESLGVKTYRDLASYSADALESKFKEAGKIVSRAEIEKWIAEARRLAEDEAEERHQPSNESQTGDNESNSNSQTGEEGWIPIASFVIEFHQREIEGGQLEEHRTKAHHLEADEDAYWPGIESVKLTHWLLEQVGEPVDEIIEQIYEQFRQQVQNELDEMRAESKEALKRDIDAERSRLMHQLNEEIEQEQRKAQKVLDQEISETRSSEIEKLEQEMEEIRAAAMEKLEQDVDDEGARLRLALRQEMEKQRISAEKKLEGEIDVLRYEAEKKLQQGLEKAPPTITPERELTAEPASRERAERMPAEGPFVDKVAELRVTGIRAYQASKKEKALEVGVTETSPDILTRDIPHTIEVSFEVKEADITELVENAVSYSGRLHARDLSTGVLIQLGGTHPRRFIKGESSYQVKFEGVKLATGTYRLVAIVATDSEPPSGGSRVVSMVLAV